MLKSVAPHAVAADCAAILGEPAYTGLKAILDQVSVEGESLYVEIKAAHNYEELLSRLGHKLILTKQIHVQDCYWRLSPAGGIRAVLPYYDIPSHSSFPTLVNSDSTVSTTPRAAAFFNALLAQLKRQLGP